MSLESDAEAILDLRAAKATASVQETRWLTTLAMIAARCGLDSLTEPERHDLLCFSGFDIFAFSTVWDTPPLSR